MKRDAIEDIRTVDLLLAAFNALQPGVFAISGWDLVGALPLMPIEVPDNLLYSGLPPQAEKPMPDESSNHGQKSRPRDYRWLNRGAYKLLSTHNGRSMNILSENEAVRSLPEAKALYGPIDRQIEEPFSFFSQLKQLLGVREEFKIHIGQFGGVLDLGKPELFGMLTWLPEQERPSSAVTAIFNFAKLRHTPTSEALKVILQPYLLDGWVRHWQKRWVNGKLTTVDDKDAQKERARLGRWKLFDALPNKKTYEQPPRSPPVRT